MDMQTRQTYTVKVNAKIREKEEVKNMNVQLSIMC